MYIELLGNSYSGFPGSSCLLTKRLLRAASAPFVTHITSCSEITTNAVSLLTSHFGAVHLPALGRHFF
jgi:hypothetical protein